MFGLANKKDLELMRFQVKDDVRHILKEYFNENEPNSGNGIDLESDLTNVDNVEELEKIKDAESMKRKILQARRQSQEKLGKPRDNGQESSKEEQIQDLNKKTDYIKGIWDGLPAGLKTGINLYAKKYTGGKSVDEVLNNSDLIQGLISTGANAAGSMIAAKQQGKPKLSTTLDIEMPYATNNPPNP